MKKITIFLTLLLYSVVSNADIIDVIQGRGVLIVGVKADYKPYGYLNSAGQIQGVEPDLAREVADKLNVKLKLVPVLPSNRLEYLSQKKIDLLIATMTDKPDRRKVVLMSDQHYYSSGTNVIALKGYDFNQWDELSGKKVCLVEGVFYKETLEKDYGVNLVILKKAEQALNFLRQKRCVAFAYDDSYIAGLLTDAKWSNDFEMPFETIIDAPWSLAVTKGENRFHKIMDEMIIDWHKTGKILSLEAKHGLQSTSFAVRKHKSYNEILKIHTKLSK